MMTQLLVSVRDAEEAELAVRAGVDLIDVKDPARGSLGAADVAVALDIARRVAGRAPLSRATGELRERCHSRLAANGNAARRGAVNGAPRGLAAFAYAKCGLARCRHWPEWREALRDWRDELPETTAAVAVVYADEAAEAPRPADVLATAGSLGFRGVLVDTHDKRGGDLLRHWTLDRVRRFVDAVREHDLLIVLAGSLREATIARLLPLRPDYVAVRGAACRSGRGSRLDETRTAQLVRLVASSAGAVSAP